jgi:hypothetical protein
MMSQAGQGRVVHGQILAQGERLGMTGGGPGSGHLGGMRAWLKLGIRLRCEPPGTSRRAMN